MVSQLSKDLIRDEGLRLTAYKDSVGLWTIGVGHLLGTRPRMTEITFAEAMALLAADIEIAEGIARKWVPSLEADETRWRAACNMAFNLGDRIGQFKRFIYAVENQDWPRAAAAMLDSKWARQVGVRAIRLSLLIEKGGS
jgi:lysozyme